jgi:RNA polymerase subunit RPABC4/transcription elongation factor Spt4
LRVFKHRNTIDPQDVCPICKTNEDDETVLVIIDGTQEGNIAQAKQFHLKCIDLMYLPPDKKETTARCVSSIYRGGV